MDGSRPERELKKKIIELRTFSVPISLGEIIGSLNSLEGGKVIDI
tara:strand:- start:530 stop:664 length:135 start_codon:yes stop_codon:yes gene_type:complete